MPIAHGTRFSQFEIVSAIGAGGMGEVYKARDLKLGREVAIKVLPRDMAKDSQRLRRFEQEARAASALSHPNIVTVYEIGEHDGNPFIAMEYVRGRTLREILAAGRLPNDKVARYAIQVAEGLAKAHQAGIVHRDLKPENIIVSEDDYIKILDFGLAKLLPLDTVDSDVATMDRPGTTPGTLVGTVSYMSPEQAKGQPTDFRSDQFSFGAVLYEMASGQKAFGRETGAESLAAILKEEPRLEGALAAIVERCLKKRPNERWANTEELVSALREPQSSQPSVAVLPFANMSADPEQEYFCEGIAEDIINALTRVQNLRVVARTSAFVFKGQNLDIRDIGKKLAVSHVLEGSVRRSGNRLRITTQLVSVDDGYHLWSERFDRDLDDIFAIQDEISLAIVEKLKVNLLGGESEALVKRPTENVELHNLYLLGRYHWNRLSAEDIRKSEQYFKKAVELDPDYAPAQAGLATINNSGFSLLPPRVALPRTLRAAERALELDPSNTDAHCALVIAKVFYERDWRGALFHCHKALEADPNASWPHGVHAMYLSATARHDEAIAEAEQAVALDPLSPLMLENTAAFYYWARDYGKARHFCERCFSLAPGFEWAHLFLGLTEIQLGESAAAVRSLERAGRLGKPYLGYLLGARSERTRAEAILEGIEAGIAKGTDSQYNAAIVHFGLGTVERCLECLQASTEESPAIEIMSAWAKVEPFWDPLRSDARFKDVVRRMNIPD